MGRILLVDGNPAHLQALAADLQVDGHSIWVAAGFDEARQFVASGSFDALFTEQALPDGQGFDVVAAARANDPALSVIVLTGLASAELGSQSLQRGASEFLTKPAVPEQFRHAAQRACERTALLRENLLLRTAIKHLDPGDEIFGEDSAIHKVREQIASIAPQSLPVLISGESGTGKELVARAIHRASKRRARPFVRLSANSLSEVLERGADPSHSALLNAAHQGTLLLDEIGGLSHSAQSKLLRLVVGGELRRTASSYAVPVDARFLIATRNNLREKVKDGVFREDVFEQLIGTHIHLPPLRERVSDIPGLTTLFSRQVARELQLMPTPISGRAMEKLQSYSFPGNLRELRNLVQRAYMLSTGPELDAGDFVLTSTELPGASDTLRAGDPQPGQPFDLPALLEQTEKGLIRRTLAAANGAQAEAARRLGISRSLLAYKLNKYGIRPPE